MVSGSGGTLCGIHWDGPCSDWMYHPSGRPRLCTFQLGRMPFTDQMVGTDQEASLIVAQVLTGGGFCFSMVHRCRT